MSQYNEGPTKTFTSGEALAAFRRVKLDGSGNVVYADSGEDWLGVTEEAVAISTSVSVRLRTAAGTMKVTAAGAFSINALLYGADDGKVDDAVAGSPVMRAFEAATADGDILEAIKVEGVNVAGDANIWVSPKGDDSGDGSLISPLLTIAAAFAAVTATRKKIIAITGEYSEAAALTWPDVNGVELLAAFGEVTINLATPVITPVLTIHPSTATSTWSATISKEIDIESNFDSGVALRIDNTHITKKMNIYLGAGLSTKNVTDTSLAIVNGAGSGQAIRVYANTDFNTWEGAVTFTAADASDRLRVYNTRIIGAITQTGAVAVELTFINSAIPTVTKTSEAALNNINCWHETDADPDVYTAYTNAYDT